MNELCIESRINANRNRYRKKNGKILFYLDRRSERMHSFACFITSVTSSSNLSINCAISEDVIIPGHVLQVHSVSVFKGSFGNMSPFPQGHFSVPKCVPNSVGSEQRLHRQVKYFVARRCSRLALVDQSA